jgi:hypothetical protein
MRYQSMIRNTALIIESEMFGDRAAQAPNFRPPHPRQAGFPE